MAKNFTDIEKLVFEISRYSSYSTSYLPENILEDCPGNQASRWSSNNNNPQQFLTLKLKRPAVVHKIKFGKFEKSHVCNLKKFRIYGGLADADERMVLLYEGGLKNDSNPETFILRCLTEDGEKLPILYVKIVPLLSWGPSFNFSIWHVELYGQDDPMYLGPSLRNYNMLRETEIVKLCLKHFRQQGYDAAFRALQEQTNINLERPLISDLHKYLVADGDFQKAEDFLENCVNTGLMDGYLEREDYKHSWKLQETTSDFRPGNRGGHQLIVDNSKRLVYLYGGWDGFQDLSDFWVFDMRSKTWSLIFEHSEEFNGPTPRSCHKMVFDPVSQDIFMLGRYLDNSIRTTDYIKSDFYLYDTRTKAWLQICDDTSQVGGPQLVYDHQMCIDVEKRTIYVFGGKILTPKSVNSSSSEPEYSGLFSYHIATNTWSQIFVDCHHPSASKTEVESIKSRITHCMVFHNKTRKLYIYGGQRGKEDIDDFISYDVDTQAIKVLNNENSGYQNKSEPPTGYTLRATIDCDRDEIYVFSSLSKQKDRRDSQPVDTSNSFWVYSLEANKWSKIYTCKHLTETCYPQISEKASSSSHAEPCPRYAHQLAYDDVDKVHFLFGGNPGKSTQPQLRLDDFWILLLQKPVRAEILKQCRYLVRKLHYEEITKVDPIKALQYLQNHIYEVIDHSDPAQLNNFHKLASLLFKPEDIITTAEEITPLYNTSLDARNDSESKSNDTTDTAMSPTDDLSMQSCESASSMSDSSSYDMYKKCGGKRNRDDYLFDVRTRRTYLFNKIVLFMPSNMVQPKANLSDFVVI